MTDQPLPLEAVEAAARTIAEEQVRQQYGEPVAPVEVLEEDRKVAEAALTAAYPHWKARLIPLEHAEVWEAAAARYADLVRAAWAAEMRLTALQQVSGSNTVLGDLRAALAALNEPEATRD